MPSAATCTVWLNACGPGARSITRGALQFRPPSVDFVITTLLTAVPSPSDQTR